MNNRRSLTDEEIIAALIEQGTIKAAAASLGCTVKTLYARMKKPAFKDLYAQAKGEFIKTAAAKLQGNLCGAIDVIADIMADKGTASQTRLNAAVSILQYGAKYTEAFDILERIEALENANKGDL